MCYNGRKKWHDARLGIMKWGGSRADSYSSGMVRRLSLILQQLSLDYTGRHSRPRYMSYLVDRTGCRGGSTVRRFERFRLQCGSAADLQNGVDMWFKVRLTQLQRCTHLKGWELGRLWSCLKKAI